MIVPVPDVLRARVARFNLDDRGVCSIQRRDPEADRWMVYRATGEVLNRDGLWEHEPLPSSRTDEFTARTRHTLAECVALAQAKGLLPPT